MRCLIADKLHPRAIEELKALAMDVVYEPELTKESLEAKLGDVGVLVVRSTEVTEKALQGANKLNLIVRAGNEVHTIDVREASRRGIYVSNCPGKNASAVAELVLGLLVAIDRRIPDAVASLQRGQWMRTEFSKAEGLQGKTLGIAGFGAIGREVAQRARAFGLHPLAWSRGLTKHKADDLGVAFASSLEELAQKSDILTVHLPLNDRTRQIIDAKIFAAMPKRSIFLNLAREGLVDYAALREAVTKRGLRAAVDVYPNEPKGKKEFATDLFGASESGGFLYGTPHIAASTDQAQFAIASEVVRVIRSFMLEGDVPNVMNVPHASAARFQMVIRMLDKVGTLANVLSVLKRHGINIEEVKNSVFEGGAAAAAKLRLLSRPSEACLTEIRAFEEILHVDVVTLPNFA